MKALLIGLGRWGAEIVNDFCCINKKTDWPVEREGLKYEKWDIVKNPGAFIGLTDLPTNIVMPFLYFNKSPQMMYCVLFSFYIFLLFIGALNAIFWLIFISRLGKHIFNMKLEKEEREMMKEIRKSLRTEKKPLRINEKWKGTLYKCLTFQNKTLIITFFLSFIFSVPFAIYFHNNYSYIEGLLDYLERLPLMNKPFLEYLVTSVGIPAIIALVIRRIFLVYYLPQPRTYDFGEKKYEKVRRSNIKGVGLSLFKDIDDLRYIERRFFLSEKPGDTKYKLRDKVVEIFDNEIKKAEIFDVLIFFGAANSKIVEDFCHIAASLKRAITQPIWFYMHISGNFMSREQITSLKRMISEVDGVFVEEESGRIFRLSHEEENIVRTKALERLLIIGESRETRSVRAIDFGDIKNFIRKNSLSVLAYGYLDIVPEELGHSHKIATELFNMTINERIFCDINPTNATYALSIVKTTGKKEEGPVFYYDAIKDQMWEIFGENIQVFDMQYVLYDINKTPYCEVESYEIVIDHPDRGLISLPRQMNLQFFDHLVDKNLLVEDIKPKEILTAFTGIDSSLILDKYLPEVAYEEDFNRKVRKGIVIDPSFFSSLTETQIKDFISDYSRFGIGNIFISPSLFETRKFNEAIGLLVEEEKIEITSRYLRSLTTSDPELLKGLIERSFQETKRSQEFIDQLSAIIKNTIGVEMKPLAFRVAAEELWLSYILDIPILSFGSDSEVPLILQLCKRIGDQFKITHRDITSKLGSLVKEWDFTKSIAGDVQNLYIIFPKFQYSEKDESKIGMKSLEYVGGMHDSEEE